MTEPKTADQLIQELNNATEGAAQQEPAATFDEPVHEQTESGQFDTPKPERKPEPKPEITATRALDMARGWVKKFSSLQKILYTPLYGMTILAKGDKEKMRDFVAKNKALSEKQKEEAIHSDHELSRVADRFDKYVKACESIPLDADEIEDLAAPLSELIIKYKNLQLSPEWMLVISLAFVTLGRVAPMMPDMSKIFADDK